jgi:hypothetical protein
MRLPNISIGGIGLLLGVVLALGARAQTESLATTTGASESAPAAEADRIKDAYAHAKPYMDNPLPQLKRAVPLLGGLKADASQSNLQSILDRTGEVIQAQVPKIPDLAAHESVSQGQLSASGDPGGVVFMAGGGRRGASPAPNSVKSPADEREIEESLHLSLLKGTPPKDFDYMMLSRESPEGIPWLEESRTDIKATNGGRAGDAQNTVHGTGFGYMWLLFLPQNMLQSSYRFLGQQKMYGHETYVVAFAQSPDRVRVPGEITLFGTAYPLLYQGIAWIDQATFRIVRLRTDILAPLPRIEVPWLSSDLEFSEVRIPEQNLSLWLPHQVEVMWRQGDQIIGELHLYTKYRLYHATARMLPPG